MSNFWGPNSLEQIHIELTNGCNAACPMCVRFHMASPLTRPDLEIGQITLDKFKQYFPAMVLKSCKRLLFCGVHGDAGTARDTLEIMQYISDTVMPKKHFTVKMHSNGGMRNSDWWRRLGEVFADADKKGGNWSLTFSVDGLEDTNHLYRRNVVWSQLIENIKAYLSTGARADWDFLIFDYNEHQLGEAAELAMKLGFQNFRPKKALGVDNGKNLVPLVVRKNDGTIDYYIRAPKDPANRNLENPEGNEIVYNQTFDPESYWKNKRNHDVNLGNNGVKTDKQITFEENYQTIYETLAVMDLQNADKTEVQCKSAASDYGREIFVDQAGRVLPCCYIGTHLNSKFFSPSTAQLHKAMSDYGWEKFDLNLHSMQEILAQGHLNNLWQASWNKDSVKNGKMLFCTETCPKQALSAVDKIYMHKDLKDRPKHLWKQFEQLDNGEIDAS